MRTSETELTHAFLDALFDVAPFGLALLDLDLRYLRVNRHLAELNGASPAEHVGRTVGEMVPGLAPALQRALEAIVEGSEPITLEVSGERRPEPGLRRTSQTTFFPVREDGELVGVAAIIRDETAARNADAQRERIHALERTARSHAEGAELRSHFLLESGTLLDASLDLKTTLRTLSRIIVPRLAHLCMIDMVGLDGATERVAVAHADATREALVWELTRRWPSGADATGEIREAIRSGETQYRPEVTPEMLARAFPSPEHRAFVETLELRSAIIVPLRARDRTLGAITLALDASSARPFGPEDVTLVEELARRASLAVDNSRLFTELSRADRAQRFLAEASHALSGSLDWNTTLDTVARLAVAGIADLCMIEMRDPLGDIRVAALEHVDPHKAVLLAETARRYPTRAGSPHAGRALATGESVLRPELGEAEWAALAEDEEHLRRLRALGLTSALWVPMYTGGRRLGSIGLGITESDRAFTAADLALAEELGRRAGVAADNARLYSDRSRVARTLQRSLVPARLPEIDGLEAAVRFRAAGDGAEVGGDFYDVFPCGPERFTAAVGDVCGKGASAAALTALSRHTIRAAARYESGPDGVLRTLNAAIPEQSPELMFCTAALVELTPAAGACTLRVALGGHLPPLVLRADGTVDALSPRGALLGVFPEIELEVEEAVLRPGDAVVLYTDGVTEAGAPSAPLGEEWLAATLATLAGRDADGIAAEIEARVLAVDKGAPRDDVAVLVLRLSPG